MDHDVNVALDTIADEEMERGVPAAEVAEMRDLIEGVLNGEISEEQAIARLEALGFDVMPSDALPTTGPWADWGTWAEAPSEDTVVVTGPDGDEFQLDMADDDFAELFWERTTRSERLHRRSRNIQLAIVGSAVALIGAVIWKLVR